MQLLLLLLAACHTANTHHDARWRPASLTYKTLSLLRILQLHKNRTLEILGLLMPPHAHAVDRRMRAEECG